MSKPTEICSYEDCTTDPADVDLVRDFKTEQLYCSVDCLLADGGER